MKWLLIFCLLFSSLLAKHVEIHNTPENDPLKNSWQILPSVNPITGEYIEEETDLTVAGCEPLSVRRFYCHTSYEPRTGGWIFNPETYVAANFDWEKQPQFAAIGHADGKIVSLDKRGNYTYLLDVTKQKSLVNAELSGQSHPLNITLNYCRLGDPKEKYRFCFQGTIKDGSGTVRQFASPFHTWEHDVEFTSGNKGFFTPGSKYKHRAKPDVWTPFFLTVQEEKKPNGNVIRYSYIHWHENPHWPTPLLLNTITAFNHDLSVKLAELTFFYTRDKKKKVIGISIHGSDGRKVRIEHSVGNPIMLCGSYPSGKPWVSYNADGKKIYQVNRPDGHFVKTLYTADNKVESQHGPYGQLSQYLYGDIWTCYWDAARYKTIYRFNNDKRITTIEKYCNGTLVTPDLAVYRFEWEPATGNLTHKTVEDPTGRLLQYTHYKYDKRHNAIEETLGDSKGSYTLYREYNDLNLKVKEWDDFGKLTNYIYLPNTNLLASEICGDKKITHFYQDSICVKTILEDGHIYKVTEITPNSSPICTGLPASVAEKTKEGALIKKVNYHYHPSGKIEKEEHFDAENILRYSLRFTYDKEERLMESTDALNQITKYEYDANHNLTKIVTPSSTKEMTYDLMNRCVKINDNGWITQKSYDLANRVISETDPSGFTTRYTYDPFGNLTATYYPDGSFTLKEYDPLGNILKETDANGYITHKEYNFRGQPTVIYYPDGSEEKFVYNPGGTLAEQIDRNGNKTEYTYNSFDQVIKKQTLAKVSTATYSPTLQLSATDPEKTTTYYIYDTVGRKIAEETGSRKVFYEYDTLGRLCKTKQDDAVYCTEYDLLDRIIEKRTEDLLGNLVFKEEYAYDSDGNQTKVITCQGTSETHYNAHNLPIQHISPEGNVTHYFYDYHEGFTKTTLTPKALQIIEKQDSRHNLISTITLNAQKEIIQQIQRNYDKNGNRTEENHTIFVGAQPIGTFKTCWEYGPSNRLEKVIESDQKVTRYLYDPQGRLSLLIKPDQTALHHTYDAYGRLQSLSSSRGDVHYRFTYDLNDRLLSDTLFTRKYDRLGNLIEERLDNGQTFKSDYDAHGRRIKFQNVHYTYKADALYQIQFDGLTHTYYRNLAGKITESVLPASLGSVTIHYDEALRPQSIVSPYFTARDYLYDSTGNLKQYTYIDSLGPVDCQFAYDDLNQLISENANSYSYDSLYNRLTKNSLHHQVNDLCQTTHDGQTHYQYDLNGNLIRYGEIELAYDSLDRLIKVTKGKQTYEYAYDSLNRRLTKKTPTETIHYFWDDKNEIGSTQGELRILGEGFGAEIGAAVFIQLKGKTYIPLHDQRGALVTLLDTKGNSIETHRYTAFGEELTIANISPWRFSSKRLDPESGLLYFGRRYYLPSLGRFIATDPQGFKDGPNLYAYAHNSPYLEIDLYGEFGELLDWRKYGKEALEFGFPCGMALYNLPANAPLWKRGALAFGTVGEAALTFFPPAKFGASIAEKTFFQIGKAALSRESERRMMRTAGKAASVAAERRIVQKSVQNAAQVKKVPTEGTKWRFPKNPNEFLKELPRDHKGRIYTSDNLRIRPEQHPLKPGDTYNPRHHGQHYHVETRRNPNGNWGNNNLEIIKPSDYKPGEGTGFLPGELFPGVQIYE